MTNPQWSLEGIWNETLIQERRPIEPRSHLYASEIGSEPFEVWHKMMGTQPTNSFEERVLRKFAAGKFFEDLVAHMLRKIGILESREQRVEVPATKDTLKVSGRLDFIAGGITDWSEAEKRVREADFPEAVLNIALSLIKGFREKHPGGLKRKLYECKSVNSQVFWAKKDYLEEAYPSHIFQLYTYVRQADFDEGTILYISKDDLTVKEIDVRKDSTLEKEWMDRVKNLSGYYLRKEEPPKPDFIVLDERKKISFGAKRELEEVADEGTLNKIAQKLKIGQVLEGYKIVHQGCYEVNWRIPWSIYRDLITGTKGDEEFEKWEYLREREASERNQNEIKKPFIERLKAEITREG